MAGAGRSDVGPSWLGKGRSSCMSRSVAGAARVTEGNAVATPYLNGMVGAVPNPPEETAGNSLAAVDLCALLSAAIDATGSRKEAAISAGLSEPALSKQLARIDNAAPRLDRVGQLKPATLLDFAKRIETAVGAGDPKVERRQAAEDAMRAIGRLVAVAVGE